IEELLAPPLGGRHGDLRCAYVGRSCQGVPDFVFRSPDVVYDEAELPLEIAGKINIRLHHVFLPDCESLVWDVASIIRTLAHLCGPGRGGAWVTSLDRVMKRHGAGGPRDIADSFCSAGR